nr:OsmC family protein [uncultured Sphaerochaeta sp.]
MANSDLKNKLVKKIESLKTSPSSSKAVFRSETRLVEGVLCNATIRQFNLNVDEPAELGGNDIAPNPVELVLAALGTCQEILYGAYSAVLEIPVDAVKVNVKGTLDLKGLFALDDNTKAGFQEIEYETEITSSAEEKDVQKLINLVENHCPVLDTLTRAVIVKGKTKITRKLNAA